MRILWQFFSLIVFLPQVSLCMAEMVVSYPNYQVARNSHHYSEYYRELLQLTLDKTVPNYGAYRIVDAPPSMTLQRLIYVIEQDTFPNLVFERSYDERLSASPDIAFVPFPVDLGMLGYRICFVNPAKKEQISKVQSLAELRKFTIGQGQDWADTLILRHNGFTVVEVENYKTLFAMTTAGRVDLFCRGSNQLLDEYRLYKNDINLQYDESFALIYPLPRFFILSVKNILLKQRIEAGLKLAYDDGSIKQLWNKHYHEDLMFAKLDQRRLFRLESPLLKNLSNDWQRYIYIPNQDK